MKISLYFRLAGMDWRGGKAETEDRPRRIAERRITGTDAIAAGTATAIRL